MWLDYFFNRVLGLEVISLKRMRSLSLLPVMRTEADLNALGLNLRPLSLGMQLHQKKSRGLLIKEGYAFLSYVLKDIPQYSLLARYVRATETLRNSQYLPVPSFFYRLPVLISLIDRSLWERRSIGDEFIWRLDTATMLAESTTLGAFRFLLIHSNKSQAVLLITKALIAELFWRMMRIIFHPLLRFIFKLARC